MYDEDCADSFDGRRKTKLEKPVYTRLEIGIGQQW